MKMSQTDEFLSTRQVQLRLNVDRTTIYRMLKDGRLKGVKVGRQWRFPKQQIDALLSGIHPTQTVKADPQENYPFTELQKILDVLAEALVVSLQAISTTGEALSTTSNSCHFCRLIQATKSGERACQAQWTMLARQPEYKSFTTCHAGLSYAQVPIFADDVAIGVVIAGQFIAQASDRQTQAQGIDTLAIRHKIDNRILRDAAADLTLLPMRHKKLIWDWLEKIAASYSEFSQKQQAMNLRLKQIAQMCDLTI